MNNPGNIRFTLFRHPDGEPPRHAGRRHTYPTLAQARDAARDQQAADFALGYPPVRFAIAREGRLVEYVDVSVGLKP